MSSVRLRHVQRFLSFEIAEYIFTRPNVTPTKQHSMETGLRETALVFSYKLAFLKYRDKSWQ